MFFKNKVAVTNLVIMLVLVLFTFLQPLLPNQFDPNLVNKFDEKAVWLIVDEDGKAKLSGIKYTKGDYAAETDGRNTTLAYVQAPEDWGNIKPVSYTHLDVYKRQVQHQQAYCKA